MENSRLGLTGKIALSCNATHMLPGLLVKTSRTLIPLSRDIFLLFIVATSVYAWIWHSVRRTLLNTPHSYYVQALATRNSTNKSVWSVTTSLDVPSTTKIHVKRGRLVSVRAFADKLSPLWSVIVTPYWISPTQYLYVEYSLRYKCNFIMSSTWCICFVFLQSLPEKPSVSFCFLFSTFTCTNCGLNSPVQTS